MAGLIGKYWIERFARLPVDVDVATEFRYREPPVDTGGLTIFVSQSGETADTLASLRYAKDNGRAHDRRRQRADVHASPALADVVRADARRARDRRRLDQGLHLPARRAWPRSRSALGRARGVLDEAEEARARRRTRSPPRA